MNDITQDSSTNSASATVTGERTDAAASALKSSVAADAHELADKAKEVGGGVLSHARQSAEAQVSGGKDRVAERLTDVADAIRHTGEHLRSQDQSGITEYVVRAADQVEAASDYLQGRSLGEVLTDVGAFARREPAIFLGSAFALGLVAGRFLKSSKPSPQGSMQANSGQPARSGGAHPAQQRPKAQRPSRQRRANASRSTRDGAASDLSDSGVYDSSGAGPSAKLPGAE